MGGMTEQLQIYEMDNPIQNYAWGSLTAIAELTGRNEPSEQPQAEIWMGAHPKAPSRIRYGGAWHRLDHLIERHPQTFLGPATIDRFGYQLPFLLKILAVAQPLSIQAHPNATQAKKGYAYENEQNISLSADHRNYKDDRHKPECICALTPFWGLCGFRSIEQTLRLAESVWPDSYQSSIDLLKEQGIKPFFEHLMALPADRCADLVARVTRRIAIARHELAEFVWSLRLQERYPGDIGVLSPLLLNLVELKPGQSLFLDAGQLHAYLDGVGVELMANSDNVLRGGLTPKHVDVSELLDILNFSPMSVDIQEPRETDSTESRYTSPVDDFRLSVIEVRPSMPHICHNRPNRPEILLCLDSPNGIQCRSNRREMILHQGRSLFIAADVPGYTLHGTGRAFKATVNI